MKNVFLLEVGYIVQPDDSFVLENRLSQFFFDSQLINSDTGGVSNHVNKRLKAKRKKVISELKDNSQLVSMMLLIK